MTAHVQSFSAHTLSSVNTVNAFNRHELVVSAHWQTALSAVKSKKIELKFYFVIYKKCINVDLKLLLLT